MLSTPMALAQDVTPKNETSPLPRIVEVLLTLHVKDERWRPSFASDPKMELPSYHGYADFPMGIRSNPP